MKAVRETLWTRLNLRYYETPFFSVVVPKVLKDSARGFNLVLTPGMRQLTNRPVRAADERSRVSTFRPQLAQRPF